MQRNFFQLILVSLLCINLNACIAVAVTAIGATAIIERKAIRQTITDHDISLGVRNAIYANKKLYANNHIVATVYHGSVLLVGQVLNDSYRRQAVDAVQKIDGVKKIYDQLTIQKPTSRVQRALDNGITSAINGKLSNVGGDIDVTTENGIVYLIGEVTRDQSEQASDIARRVGGVKKVVTIFTYVQPKSK